MVPMALFFFCGPNTYEDVYLAELGLQPKCFYILSQCREVGLFKATLPEFLALRSATPSSLIKESK
jgi:hypothetical protein